MSRVPTTPHGTQSGSIEIKDVAHILDLLIRHLYGSDPHLTVRELIQNAHDALATLPASVPILDRRIEIRLNVFNPPEYLEICDNGVGMTDEELRRDLCSIGDSQKLKEAIDNPEIIGRFGIGFLSCFIVADHVEVVTRKDGGATTWCWETKDKARWVIRQHTKHEFGHGTRIRLYFKDRYPPDYADRINDLRTTEGVEKVVQRFCYLIQYPIKVGRPDEPGKMVNARSAPWDDQDEAMQAFKALFEGDEPLYTHQFSAHGANAQANGAYRAAGVLYFRDRPSVSPSLQLYVRRMLVDTQDTRLLPTYAPFIQGLVECPNLNIDLSRRHVSEFDPVYKWLRATIREEFRQAFVNFASRYPRELVQLWPRIDNTVITRLLGELARSEGDQESAESFLLAAARYFPFYTVDTISGAQGRPLWCSIGELVAARRKTMPNVPKIKVQYTESTNPVEKDLLLNTYRELIDVGRPEKETHAALMKAIFANNGRFDDFEVERVSASQFESISGQEETLWRPVVDTVAQGLVFPNRQHRVVVERFQPATTPLVITDAGVNTEMVGALRGQLQELRGGPDTINIVNQLVNFLDAMSTRGGRLDIHLNANNDLTNTLRVALADDRSEVVTLAQESTMLVAWRAVLDYFGWNSTKDMLAKDRVHTHNLISNLLATAGDLADLRIKAKTETAELTRLREQMSNLNAPAQRIQAIVGFVDMVDSTRGIVANPSGGPEQAADFIRLVIQGIEGRIKEFGTPVAFTGDGLLFYLPRKEWPKPPPVLIAVKELPLVVQRLCATDPALDAIVQKSLTQAPRLRVSLSYGELYVGRVGPSVNLIGLPVVEAARLSVAKELYQKHNRDLLITEHAYNQGASWGLWQAANFVKVDTFTPGGLPSALSIYGPA